MVTLVILFFLLAVSAALLIGFGLFALLRSLGLRHRAESVHEGNSPSCPGPLPARQRFSRRRPLLLLGAAAVALIVAGVATLLLGFGPPPPEKIPTGSSASPSSAVPARTIYTLISTIGQEQGRPSSVESVVAIDPRTGAAGAPLFSGPQFNQVLLSPDGRTIYVLATTTSTTGRRRGLVTPVDLGTGRARQGIVVGLSADAAIFSAHDRELDVEDSTNGNIWPVNLENDTVGAPIPTRGDLIGLTAAPSGETVYATEGAGPAQGAGRLTPIDLTSHRAGQSVPVGPVPSETVLAPDGRAAYVLDGRGALTVVDTAAAKVRNTVEVGNHPVAELLSPDGKTLFVLNYNPPLVVAVDTATGTVRTRASLPGGPYTLAAQPRLTIAYLANNRSGTLVSLNVKTGATTPPEKVCPDPPASSYRPALANAGAVVFDRGGDLAYISCGDSLTTVQAATGALTPHLRVNGTILKIISVAP